MPPKNGITSDWPRCVIGSVEICSLRVWQRGEPVAVPTQQTVLAAANAEVPLLLRRVTEALSADRAVPLPPALEFMGDDEVVEAMWHAPPAQFVAMPAMARRANRA